jgi:hypothetical protein
VPEHGLDLLDRRSRLEGQGGGGVPEVVHPDAGDPGLSIVLLAISIALVAYATDLAIHGVPLIGPNLLAQVYPINALPPGQGPKGTARAKLVNVQQLAAVRGRR